MNIKKFKSISDDKIRNFESKIGFKLPDDYTQFLREVNGGVPKKRYSLFFVKELNREVPLDVLFGLEVDDTSCDLIEIFDEFSDDLLENSLIIGDDPGGGFIVLISNKGIYYWDHAYHFKESSDEKNIYFIANNFTEFINSLINHL